MGHYRSVRGPWPFVARQVTGTCDPTDKAAFSVLLGDNEIWAPGAKVQVSCGHTMDFAEWSATGLDVGTTVKDSSSLTAAMIVQWGMDAVAPSA